MSTSSGTSLFIVKVNNLPDFHWSTLVKDFEKMVAFYILLTNKLYCSVISYPPSKIRRDSPRGFFCSSSKSAIRPFGKTICVPDQSVSHIYRSLLHSVCNGVLPIISREKVFMPSTEKCFRGAWGVRGGLGTFPAHLV